jgi:hypothetical protein
MCQLCARFSIHSCAGPTNAYSKRLRSGFLLYIHADGVVVKPLSDALLCFNTCVILRADNASRLVNEYVRAFLRKYAPQHLAAKQMDLPLPA